MSVIVKAGSEICKANTNTSTAKFQYSFSKAERFPIPNLAEKIRTKKLQEKIEKGENVKIRESHYHFYNLPETKSTRKTTFGKGNKYDFTKVGNYCKASCYDPKTDFDKAHPHGPMYSFTKAERSGKGKRLNKKNGEEEENKNENKNEKLVDVDGPSPAVYNYLKPFGHDAPKVSMKGRHNTPIKHHGEKEGEVADEKDKKEPELIKVVIKIQPSGKYPVSQIPNVNSLKFDKDKSKRTQFDANKNPGPNAYHIPPLICNKISESQYRNYEKIRMTGKSIIKDSRSNYPGPGSYTLPSDFGIYESKDKDKYPAENVYPEKRIKPEDDKPWRHGMKKIKPKVEEEENQGGDENQYNQEENNEEPPADNNKEQQNEEKPEDKNEEAPQEKPQEKKEEETPKDEDKESEMLLLRDILVYKEGEDTANA